ncbi:MAG: hypothetical protein CMI53_04510 [Parcubacteria group bacterium]|nr:hypothetical protein [Parcubacteria group bacterium]|tara:strand:+ start:3408 stop:3845 length:438 start_codon:yes stop_codon:yes gene_type:complete
MANENKNNLYPSADKEKKIPRALIITSLIIFVVLILILGIIGWLLTASSKSSLLSNTNTKQPITDEINKEIEQQNNDSLTQEADPVDSDNDGVPDIIENVVGTDPNNQEPAGSTEPVPDPVDSDNDGVPDIIENVVGTDPNDPNN